MEARFAEQKVRWELLEWGQHHTRPVQLRCMAIALDLTHLAREPDNLTLRRETMERILRLEQAVRTENAVSVLENNEYDKPSLQQEHRLPLFGQLASPVLTFVFGFLFIFVAGLQVLSTVASR